MNCERFEFREGLLKRYLNKRKEKLFKSVTALSLPVFMRNVDVISYAPSTSGYYEARIVKIIQFFAQDNQLNDFFIDIGANIGLISCQVVSCFKECHCFEPNPDCFKILSVNLNITSNHSSEIQLYNFGLGEREFGTELVVPKSNWGGGSIVDGNGYTDALLTQNSHHDFLYYQIKIQKTSKVLGNLFLSLKKKGLKRGVIKIDVEGYELPILKEIQTILPEDFELVIIFENHEKNLLNEFNELFHGKSKLYQLTRYPKKETPSLKKLFALIKHFGYKHKLTDINSQGSMDYVLTVNLR